MSTLRGYNRLLDVALTLSQAGRVGVMAPDLMQRCDYPDSTTGKKAFLRDLDSLRSVGLEIQNLAPSGEDARYVLQPGDVRLRVEFSPEQRTALTAALVAAQGTVSPDKTALPVDLERVREAVRAGCLMRFLYNGKSREVDPYRYQWARADVVLVGRDRAAGMTKSFSVRRMQDLELGAPGTAEIPSSAPRPSLDAITWQIDPPVAAVLYCPGFCDDVIALVGGTAKGDEVHITVTNRLIFFARLIELGSRARLESPEELRTQLRQMLEAAL